MTLRSSLPRDAPLPRSTNLNLSDSCTSGNARDGTPEAEAEGEAEGGNAGWITVLSNPMTLNLFDVAETERLIATAQLPAGQITQIRLVLSDNVELVNGDSQISVACPSCATSGLKLVPKTPLAVPANGSVEVTIQMDASLLAGTSGQYMLHPVISVTD